MIRKVLMILTIACFAATLVTGIGRFKIVMETAEAFDSAKTMQKGDRVFVSKMEAVKLATRVNTAGTAYAVKTSRPLFTEHMEGEFSAMIRIHHITVTGTDATGGVKLWYQISNVSDTSLGPRSDAPYGITVETQRDITDTWFTPTTSTLLTASTTGTFAQSVNLIAARFVRFLTDVTGTTEYEVIIHGR